MIRHRRNRGILLFEILIVLALLAVFLIVSARLFTSMIRLSRQASDAEDRMARFDSAVRMLRSDAWGAAEMSVDAGEALTLSTDGGRIEWRSDEPSALTRIMTASDGTTRQQRWPELGGRLRFRVEGPVLIVAGDERSGRAGEMHLTSQVQLAGAQR
jgi:Tfp pilus assembly protein PilX